MEGQRKALASFTDEKIVQTQGAPLASATHEAKQFAAGKSSTLKVILELRSKSRQKLFFPANARTGGGGRRSMVKTI